MKKIIKNLWRAFLCILKGQNPEQKVNLAPEDRDSEQKANHTPENHEPTWEDLWEAYHRDPKDFPKIKQDDRLFACWVEDVIRYDHTCSDIIEYRLKGVPFEEYFETEIPFSQLLILLQGVIKEYNSARRNAPLEDDFLDCLQKFPVSQENFDALLHEIEKINAVTQRVSLREQITKLKERQSC